MNKRVAMLYTGALGATFLLFSCGEDEVQDEVVIATEDTLIDDRVDDVRTIFHSIPSPVQTSQLLEQAGATYNPDYVNDVLNTDNYLISQKKMALNLGVFGADLSYNSVFDRTEENMFTFQACDKLAEEMGLSDAFDASLFERVEMNYNNRDSMIDIISETYWTADDYLRENKRHNVAAMIIAGGWIEGLYIATRMANDENSDPIIERVAEQKYSLSNLISLVESYQTDDGLDEVMADLKYLEESYNKVTIDYTKGETQHNPETGITTIGVGGGNDITIEPDVLAEITSRVAEIRNRYVE